MAPRPLIGITSYVQRVQWGVWDTDAALVPLVYARAVEEAGGRPLVVPPAADGIGETLDALDGVIFSGGGDLDPELYGAEAHDATDAPRKQRDAAELRLLEAALDRDMPVLAICRGIEVLNVVRGGDLHQHVPDLVGHHEHKETPGEFSEHEVDLLPGTKLSSILGHRAPVKSHHHQAPARLGRGLVRSATADDGTIEGLEDPELRFVVGVLWHPEEGEDMALFEAFVAEAREYRVERTGAGLAARHD
jgi:putative glutamine amidotransferase